uniref:Uncharacterized protein n=1 Tax=Knipowitschia caucasica TaxID=637954 RepID=A0AAV2KPM4_KNICA
MLLLQSEVMDPTSPIWRQREETHAEGGRRKSWKSGDEQIKGESAQYGALESQHEAPTVPQEPTRICSLQSDRRDKSEPAPRMLKSRVGALGLGS